jgi:hypothetical protein
MTSLRTGNLRRRRANERADDRKRGPIRIGTLTSLDFETFGLDRYATEDQGDAMSDAQRAAFGFELETLYDRATVGFVPSPLVMNATGRSVDAIVVDPIGGFVDENPNHRLFEPLSEIDRAILEDAFSQFTKPDEGIGEDHPGFGPTHDEFVAGLPDGLPD